MKHKLIKRSEQQYIDIENFNDYELTNCIAFEMIIRNNIILKELESYIDVMSTLYENPSNIFNLGGSKISIYLNETDFIDGHSILQCENAEFNAYEGFKTVNTPLEFYNFSKFHNISYKNKPFSNISAISINEYQREKFTSIDIDSKIHNGFIVLNSTKAMSFSSDNSLLDKNDIFIELKNDIYMKFSRPILRIPDEIDKRVNLMNINLNLPEKELVAYIKHIKNQFDNSPEIIKTPIEILGEKLKKIDQNFNIPKTKNNSECINPRKHLNTKQKLADMLYIYDAIKKGISKSNIQLQLTYHKDNQTLVDQKTITKYYEIAKEYIDNEKYIELITQIS